MNNTQTTSEPSNHQAELEVLASALMDTDRAKELTRQLTAADFYSPHHRDVFGAIATLVNRGDEVTPAGVIEALGGKLMPSDLAELMKNFMPSNDRANVKIITDNTYLRQLISKTRLFQERAFTKDYQDIEAFAAEVEAAFINMKPGGVGDVNTLLQTARQRTEVFFEEAINREPGPLGYRLGYEFRGIEERLDGIQQGLYLLSSTPNSGKTTLLINLAYSILEENADLHVAFFSMDDHVRKLYFRLLAGAARLPINYVSNVGARLLRNVDIKEPLRGQCFQHICKAKDRVDKLLERLHIFDVSDGTDINFIDETIRALSRKFGGLVVIIDGLSKVQIRGFKGEATARVTELSARLKRISNENNCPLFATAELRKLNHQGPPSIDDLRDSGMLSYDADVVLLAYNEWSVKNGQSDRFRITRVNVNGRKVEFLSPVVQLTFAKNKLSGYRGNIDLLLVPDLASVTELEYFDALAQAEAAFG